MSRPEELLECEDDKFTDEVFKEYQDYIGVANLLVKTNSIYLFSLVENDYEVALANEWLRNVNSTGKLAYYLYNLPEEKFKAIANTVMSIVIKEGILL